MSVSHQSWFLFSCDTQRSSTKACGTLLGESLLACLPINYWGLVSLVSLPLCLSPSFDSPEGTGLGGECRCHTCPACSAASFTSLRHTPCFRHAQPHRARRKSRFLRPSVLASHRSDINVTYGSGMPAERCPAPALSAVFLALKATAPKW